MIIDIERELVKRKILDACSRFDIEPPDFNNFESVKNVCQKINDTRKEYDHRDWRESVDKILLRAQERGEL